MPIICAAIAAAPGRLRNGQAATALNAGTICCAGKAAKYLGKLGKKIASNFGASDQEPKSVSGARKVVTEGDGDLGAVPPPPPPPPPFP